MLKNTSGSITTSGSAIFPDYKPRVYDNIANYVDLFKDNPDEQKEFIKQVRDFYITQMKADAVIDEETYRSQKKIGFWIFIIVIFLVFCGIGFSAVQLYSAMKLGDYSQLQTVFEFEKAGKLVLTTSIVGAFVLVVSLLFFFLFLQFVYKPNNKRTNFFDNIKNIKDLFNN